MIKSIISYAKNIMSFPKKNIDDNLFKDVKNISAILNNYNINRSILQGLYIRDVIGIDQIVKKIFIEKMGLNFIYEYWNIEQYVKDFEDFDYDNNNNNNNIKDNIISFISKKISHLNKGNIYFIHLNLHGHVNLIYIDTKQNYKWKYYYYEPHMPEINIRQYIIIDYIKECFYNSGYDDIILPKFLLKQQRLPLCYMYILNFFLNLYLSNDNCSVNIICEQLHNIYIMDFTEIILKLCRNSNLIDNFYFSLLTNDVINIKKLCYKKNICTKDFLLYCCEPSIFLLYLEKHKIHINYLQINLLHDEDIDFYYIIEILENIKKNDNISSYNKHQMLLLSLVMNHYFDIKSDILIMTKKEIDQKLFVDIIDKTNVLFYYLNYNFYKNVFEMICDKKEKKNIIDKIYNNKNIMAKCSDILSRYISSLYFEKKFCGFRKRTREE